MSHQLCKEYPALSPFEIDEKKYVDVIGIYADVRTYQIRQEKKIKAAEKKSGVQHVTKNGEEIIRRPAGDNWY